MVIRTENNRAFYAACTTLFLLTIEWGIATGFLPVYIYELGGSPVEVGLVFTVFSAFMVPFPLLWGGLSDATGRRKRFLVAGMLGLFPIYLVMAFQRDVFALILLRGITAILKGAVLPCTWALVSDLSFPESVGRNMGVLGFAQMAGFALGPVLGGVIAEGFGFQTLWFFVAGLCLTGGVLALIAVQDSVKLRHRSGSVFNLVRLRGIVTKILVPCLASVVFLPGISFLGPNLNVYLIRDLGFSKPMVGLFALVGTGGASLLQPVFGYYSDRWGRKPVMAMGALCLALGNLTLLGGGTARWVMLSQVLLGCHNVFTVAMSAYLNDLVSQDERSGALGILSSIGNIARSSASAIGGLVITVTGIPTALTIAAMFPFAAIFVIGFAVKESRTFRSTDSD